MNNAEEFNHTFEQTVRKDMRFYDKDQINWVKLPEQHVSYVHFSGYFDHPSPAAVEEYCDWFDVKRDDKLESVAVRLGHMCASAYNALVGNAMRKYGVGVYITDLFENNVKVVLALPDTPSVCDPAGANGWASYKFKFAASSAVK